MKNFKYVVIALNMLLQSHAYAQMNIESLAPGISAKVDIKEKDYNFEVALEVPNTHDMTHYKNQVINGNIISQVSGWVKEAKFVKVAPDTIAAKTAEQILFDKWKTDKNIDMANVLQQADIYNFTLSISHAIAGTFVHRFLCRDIELRTSQWHQVCEQTPPITGDSPILHNTKIDILCVNPTSLTQAGTKENTRCYFNMIGQSTDLTVSYFVGSKTVSGPTMIGTFVREYVTFVSHLGLIVNNNAKNVKEAKDLYKKSTYKHMVEELKERFDQNFDNGINSLKFDAVIEVTGVSETFNTKKSNVVFNPRN